MGGRTQSVTLIGDIGGHPDELRRVLAALPRDGTVVQVGDLVDRGPDSRAVLRLVDPLLDARWVQLAGNHESQYLPGGREFWPERLASSDAALLRARASTGRPGTSGYAWEGGSSSVSTRSWAEPAVCGGNSWSSAAYRPLRTDQGTHPGGRTVTPRTTGSPTMPT